MSVKLDQFEEIGHVLAIVRAREEEGARYLSPDLLESGPGVLDGDRFLKRS
jgi:hypothetical protein